MTMNFLEFKKFEAKIGGLDKLAPEILRNSGITTNLHFNRDGRRLCNCCVLEGIARYGRIRQFNLDGKSYLVACDTVHGRTQHDERGKPIALGIQTDVFSEENMRTAEIFEIERASLDRSDLRKGQRPLKGEEREALVKSLLGNKGELLQLSNVERKVDGKWEKGAFYLGDEETPEMQEGSIFVSVVT